MKVIDIHTHCPPDDPDMDAYVAAMDECGVSAAVVHGVGEGLRDRLAGNDEVLRAVRKHPGRIIGGAHIDLREPVDKTISVIERYAAEGFKFVKMFPNLGFDPNDDAHEPVWQEIEAHGLACMSHCGWLGPVPGARISALTATPYHFEVPARRHPRINFIMAHMGGAATYVETIVMTSRLPNFYADATPGWGKWVFESRMPGLQSLDFRHILFGTDHLKPTYAADIPWWTATLHDMGRSDADIEDFFYNNAARLLGLP